MRIYAQRAALVLGLSVLTAFAVPPARADFQKGVTAYTAGDFETAATEWRATAETGDVAAMRNLAHLYRWGKGVPQDLAEARKWYERSATYGLDRSMVNLAVMLLEGDGGPVDVEGAVDWLEKASEAGNPDAMVRLAILMEQGIGTDRDPAEARRLLTKAAALGNEDAADRLKRPPMGPVADGQVSAAGQVPVKTPTPTEASEVALPKSQSTEAESETPETTPVAAKPDTTPPSPTESDPPKTKVEAAPKLPPVQGPETVEGTMLHLGAFPSRSQAEAAWQDVVEAIPDLGQADPYLLSGYVPGRGDIVRLYARPKTDAQMKGLCADLITAGRACEPHRFFK